MNQGTTYFLRGLLILLPVVVTGYVIYAVFQALDETVFSQLGKLVRQLQGKEVAGVEEWVLTGLGLATTIVLITAVGMFASNFLGRLILRVMEKLVEKLPLVKLLYNSIKDVMGALVGDKKSFDRPVLVSLNDSGAAKVLGFITRDDLEFISIADHVAVYLPQSYNFAGNLLVVPSDRIQPVDAPSGDVMTFLVSGGVSGKKSKSETES